MKKKYTFEEILTDENGCKLIEALEYVIVEANAGNKDKQEITDSYAESLQKEFGYDYLAIYKEW